MSETPMTQRQMQHLQRLSRLSTELSAGLAENRQRLQDRLQSADQQCTELTAHLDQQSREAIGALEDEYNRELEAAHVRLEAEVDALEQQRGAKSDQLSQQRARAIAAALEDFETTDLRLRDRRIHEAEQLKKRHEQFVTKCQRSLRLLQQLRHPAGIWNA